MGARNAWAIDLPALARRPRCARHPFGKIYMRAEHLTSTVAAPRPWLRWAMPAALLLLLAAGFAAGVPPAPRAIAASGDAARGRQLIAAYHCGHCHDIPGAAAARGTLGPPLQGIARRSYIAGVVPMRLDTLQRWIIDPAALVPGTPMPALGVNESDARDIVAYLATLR
jgi:cytochrome c